MHKIEYWSPVGRAWERMKDVLFRPFDFGKWMVIGFCAFLANCGRDGGSGGNGGGGSNRGSRCGGNSGGCSGDDQTPREIAINIKETLVDAWDEYAVLIVSITAAVLLLLLGITLLVNWLNSRGQFMFLDNVLKNRGAVSEPWHQYKQEARSLFIFQVLLGVVSFVAVLSMILGICVLIWQMMMAEGIIASSLGVAIGLVLGFFVLCIVLGFVQMLLREFIVPLMYLNRCSVRSGFAVFAPLFKQNFWKFVLYGLVLWVISFAIGIAVLIGILLTCCTAFLILIIPYLGTVALLPVFVFRRFIGPEFLRQFGDEYDCFAEFESSEPQQLSVSQPGEDTTDSDSSSY